MLIGLGPRPEEVAQFVVASTEPFRRSWALKPPHRLVTALDAAVILLQPVVQVGVVSVQNVLTQFTADCPRVAVVAILVTPHVTRTLPAKIAAAMSRCSLNITSTSVPLRSMGAIQIAPCPCTLI